MKRVLAAVALLVGIDGAIVAEGQSLADVARKEAERRRSVSQPWRRYTNEDLARTPSPTTERPHSTLPLTPQVPVSPAVAQEGAAADPLLPSKALEDQWRSRVAAQREALARAEIVAAALQSRINALTTDSVNRDDPAQRAVLLDDRNAAALELERVQQEIVAGNAKLAAMLEEARRAGIPPGWVRERGR